MILTLLIVIFLGVLYGFREGMVMTQSHDFASTTAFSGVRSHTAFPFYHTINTLYNVLLIISIIILYKDLRFMSLGSYIFMLSGLSITAWRFSEIAYSISRYGRWKRYEHVNFLDIISFRLRNGSVVYWNFLWAVIAVVLLIVGGK